jgi:hypothetical protein
MIELEESLRILSEDKDGKARKIQLHWCAAIYDDDGFTGEYITDIFPPPLGAITYWDWEEAGSSFYWEDGERSGQCYIMIE